MAKIHLSLFQVLHFLSFAFFFTEGSKLCIQPTESNPCVQDCIFTDLQDINAHIIGHLSAEIYFCSVDYDITIANIINFTDLVAVSLIGVPSRSYINCRNKTAGFHFKNVSAIEIRNIQLSQCRFQNASKEIDKNFDASIYITDSVNISLTNVMIQNCTGVAMGLVNNQGRIEIADSTFDNNHALNHLHPGGGLYIESSTIQSCTYHIENCIFHNNTANNGAALGISIQSSAYRVVVLVEHSQFHNNIAHGNGGAVAAGFNGITGGNKIQFSSCNFTANRAENGGSLYLYTAPGHVQIKGSNSFEFRACNWTENKAIYGAAIMITPHTVTPEIFYQDGELPTSLFQDCMLVKNRNIISTTEIQPAQKHLSPYHLTQNGNGALYAKTNHILLQGKVQFIENHASAVYLLSGLLEIAGNSCIEFAQNSGYKGGAIYLQDFAAIYVNDDILIVFENNSALEGGGAIFHEALSDPSLSTAQKCFLKYVGKNITSGATERNISINFANNTVNQSPETIFLFSSKPCRKGDHRGKSDSVIELLSSIANFSFEEGRHNNSIATLASGFIIKDNLPRSLIAGKEIELEISAIDDSKVEVSPSVFIVLLNDINGDISIDPAYTIVTNRRIKLLGTAGSSGTLMLALPNQLDTSLSFDISLEYCPPGYVYDETKSECVCSANTDTYYLGINKCNRMKFRAYLMHGYWVGYEENDTSSTEKSLRISSCPLGYCTGKTEILLPNDTSIEKLNNMICSENREGVICGLCKENSSVFYHTQYTYDCKPDKYCHLGILLFIISEILPVTILFLVIIFFDIQLTTGTVNGFLFYMQIFNALSINAENQIFFPEIARKLLTTLLFIVGMSDLQFFLLPDLSFCLFKGATSLHILIFNYITVMYSLFLIILTVILMNTSCNKIKQLWRSLRGSKLLLSQSIIHGLSGFLVMCYARSTTVSLRLLIPAIIHGREGKITELVLFHFGEFKYFGNQHLKYAIPALFALLTITVIPPITLFVYPLCYKVLALFRLQESLFAKLLCKIVPLEKFKPFFDSFQSEFRDKHRYFSGLYFIYRLSALLIFIFTLSLTAFYFLLELQLILMLAIHFWVYPYKSKWHNRMDPYLFTLLLVLNTITLYNFKQTFTLEDHQNNISVLSSIQVLLAYSPLIIIITYVLMKLRMQTFIKYLKQKLQRRENAEELNDSEISLSMLDRGRQETVSNINYQKFD